MRDFTYHNPTRIELGKGKENNIGTYVSEFGVKKVLLVYGSERVKRDGLFGRVAGSLEKNGIEYVEWGGVVSNPLLSHVNGGIKLAQAEKVEGVVGVGGGSVLDSSKAIAAGALYDGDVWDLFSGKAQAAAALSVFSVLTLAATGSEMNAGAVVTNEETLEKFGFFSPHVYPKVSVINPELMASVGRDYLAYSAVDIIAHSIDAYFSAKYMPRFNDLVIESIIKTVMATTEVLLENPDDYDARAEFAWASSQALNGITFAGIEGNSYDTHIIEHAMSALYNVAHGAGLAIIIPAWMKWYQPLAAAKFDRFAQEIFGVQGGAEGIELLEAWFRKIGAPVTLAEGNIPREGIPALAENAFGLATAWGKAEQYPASVIEEILQKA